MEERDGRLLDLGILRRGGHGRSLSVRLVHAPSAEGWINIQDTSRCFTCHAQAETFRRPSRQQWLHSHQLTPRAWWGRNVWHDFSAGISRFPSSPISDGRLDSERHGNAQDFRRAVIPRLRPRLAADPWGHGRRIVSAAGQAPDPALLTNEVTQVAEAGNVNPSPGKQGAGRRRTEVVTRADGAAGGVVGGGWA